MIGRPRKQAGPELRQHREIEARAAQLQAQGILPADPGAHRLGGLPIRQSLRKRHDRHQR